MATRKTTDPRYGIEALLPVEALLRGEEFVIPQEGEYQRVLSPGKVAKYATEFDRRAFVRPVVVKRKDGSYHVVDGYHRVEAVHARADDIEQVVPVILHEGLTPKEEAALFVRLNKDRTPVSPTAEFHAECEAKVLEAVCIDKLLMEFGLDARMCRHGKKGVIPFRPITRAKAAYEDGREEALELGHDEDVARGKGLTLLRDILAALSGAYKGVAENYTRKPWYGTDKTLGGVQSLLRAQVDPPVSPEEFVAVAVEKYPTPDLLLDILGQTGKTLSGRPAYELMGNVLLREVKKNRAGLRVA